MMKKIAVFYCNDTYENIAMFDYYSQDIDVLKSLGYDVLICNRYRDIPLHFDFIFVWWWTYALYPVLLSKLFRKKSIVTGTFNFKHDIQTGVDYFSRSLLQKLIIYLSVKCASVNVFVNNSEFIDCTDYFKLKESYYIPHSVSNDFWSINRNVEKVNGIFNLTWSGEGNLRRKGIFDLVSAIGLLKRECLRVPLVLGGKKGDGFNKLVKHVTNNGLEDQVIFVGQLTKEEKINYFKKYRMYVQPSYFEGFGLATAEAMAAGATIITCDVGAVKMVVGDAGIYVTPGDIDGLASAIQSVFNSKSEFLNLETKGRSRARRLFSQSSKIEKYRDVLSKNKEGL
jgi:glycosyltransferase involved in cell wall biosynthesis